METGLLLQYAIITLAVLGSAWVVAKKQFPGSVRKLRVTLALPLLRTGKPGWMHSIGLWISPVARTGASACGGCDNCGPSE